MNDILSTESKDAILLMSYHYIENNKLEPAFILLDVLYGLFPNDASILPLLIFCEIGLDKKDQLFFHIEALEQLNVDKAIVYLLKAMALQQDKQKEAAKIAYKAYIREKQKQGL